MKPKEQVILKNIPAKVDTNLIDESKLIAKKAGFRFFNEYVDAALREANRRVKRIIKSRV